MSRCSWMSLSHSPAPRRLSLSRVVISLVAVGVCCGHTLEASGQVVRSKKPDRSVYQPPTIEAGDAEADPSPRMASDPSAAKPEPLAELIRSKPILRTAAAETRAPAGDRSAPRSLRAGQPRGGPLVDAAIDAPSAASIAKETTTRGAEAAPKLQPVAHDEVQLRRPQARVVDQTASEWPEPQVVWEGDAPSVIDYDSSYLPQHGYGGSAGCDEGVCDAYPASGHGCDYIGCNGCDACSGGAPWNRLRNGRLCWRRDQWFGSVELLLMFRDGDRPPALVTTSTSTTQATAGELGQSATRILVGGETLLDEMAVGGRLTLGTWLDPHQCRSLVLRGWFGGEVDDSFETDSSRTPVIVRPFFNVTDAQTPAQDNNLVAFPARSRGDIRVDAESTVYGGDVSVRQFWYGGLGATVDVLYGYQYMGLDESLDIATNSVAINVPNTPVGTVQSVRDSFEAENQFHGGQFGLAMRYRENCWSFNGLIKTGFGSLRRTANLRGETRNTVGTDVATLSEGFLVQSTNAGKQSDHTFGWVPELDLTLGWHRYPRFDVTCGYHLIAMTDALQVFDTVDPNLAVNAATNPTGQQRPGVSLQHDTFFVHGIHFGLQHRY